MGPYSGILDIPSKPIAFLSTSLMDLLPGGFGSHGPIFQYHDQPSWPSAAQCSRRWTILSNMTWLFVQWQHKQLHGRHSGSHYINICQCVVDLVPHRNKGQFVLGSYPNPLWICTWVASSMREHSCDLWPPMMHVICKRIWCLTISGLESFSSKRARVLSAWDP